MSAQLAAAIEFGDGDGGDPAVAPLGVLMRFTALVQKRGGPFQTVVTELLEQAIAEAAKE